MKIYNYHKASGEYINQDIADESPLEQGVYHIPAFATTITPPEYNLKTQKIFFINGEWKIENMCSSSITWEQIRIKRNNILKETDWTQLIDSPVDKQQWSAYRKELRDITKKFTNPSNVIWPEIPNSTISI